MSTITTLTAAELDAVNGAWGARSYYVNVGGNGGAGGDGIGGNTGISTGNVRKSFVLAAAVNTGDANGTGGNGGNGGNAGNVY